VTIGLLVGTWWFSRGAGGPVSQPDPVSVLVADFVNETKDQVFDGALEQALNVAIEGATFITSYSRRDAKRLAGQIKPGQTLDEEASRLVSMREGVKVVLAGTIQPRGSGYTISVKVVDPAAPQPLATLTANASNKDGVLAAVGTVASRIRSELGDVEPGDAAKETMTAASLDAVRAYSQGQDLAGASKDAEAITFYEQAIARDPNFGRAYSGFATSAYKIGRQAEAKEAWEKALSLMDRMTEREKYRTQGTWFLGPGQNPDKAIDNYEQLVKKYPADGAAHNNLAIAYFNRMDFQRAIDEGRRVRDIYPKKTLYRVNYALYSMYAGDFQTATTEVIDVIKDDPKYVKAYLPIAMAALAGGLPAEALRAYEGMGGAGASGASLAAIGLADLAIYQGRFADAEKILKDAVKIDEDSKNNKGAATKYAALAEVYAAQGRKAQAIEAAMRAVTLSRDLQPSAAAVLVDVGADKQAMAIAAELGNHVQPQSRAYAKVIEARIALRDRKTVQAIDALQSAIKLADLWTARYLLGITNVAAGQFVEAQSELDACLKRQGEASALLLDDYPTFRVMAPFKYWHGRAQEGVGQAAVARNNYAAFLALRPASPDNPLVRDAQKRVKSLK
jgi:tetratricopeptide (TPR) repeat protein